jgi:hypothetical protein
VSKNQLLAKNKKAVLKVSSKGFLLSLAAAIPVCLLSIPVSPLCLAGGERAIA